MRILVTGTSGHLGRLIVDSLLAKGVAPADIVAGARSVDSIDDLTAKGVAAVRLDYDEPQTVVAAVRGVDAVVLVSASVPGRRVSQHQAVIDAAKAAGVSRFVYTSAPFATTSELVLAPEHKATEELIAASGLNATILRNNWYTENYLGAYAQAIGTGISASSAGDGTVAMASRADYAEAAAVVLTEPGHEGRVYELAGDTALTFAEMAAVFAEVSGKAIEFQSLTGDEFAAQLKAAGVPDGAIGFTVALDANIAAGDLAFTDGTLARLIGHPTTTLRETLQAL